MITIVGRGKNSLFHFKKQNVTLAFFVWKDFMRLKTCNLLFILWRICNQCCPPTHVGFLVARILSGLFCFFFSRFSGPKRDEERQTRATGKGQAHLLFLRSPPPPLPPWRSSLALALLNNAKIKIKITDVMQAKSWVRKWLDFVKKFTVDGKSKSQFYWASCCCRNRAEIRGSQWG